MAFVFSVQEDAQFCTMMLTDSDKIGNFSKIWGFHGGDYEEWCLLGCYAVWFL
jgi:hypothetical protein